MTASTAVVDMEPQPGRGVLADLVRRQETLDGPARRRPFERLVRLIGQDRRDDAVTLFQAEVVGLPAAMLDGMRSSDVWGWFTGPAHTLPYDVALHGASCTIPRLSAPC